MVAVGEHQAGRQRVHSAMLERKLPASKTEGGQHAIVSNGAEREDGAEARHCGDLGGEKPAAVGDLTRFGLVLGRNATNCIGDAGSAKPKTVIGAGTVNALR